jgi:hypothetical protein
MFYNSGPRDFKHIEASSLRLGKIKKHGFMHLARVADVAATIIYNCNFHSTCLKSLYPKSFV